MIEDYNDTIPTNENNLELMKRGCVFFSHLENNIFI